MKFYLPLACLLFSSGLFAQKNEIIFRLNSISFSSQTAEYFTDDADFIVVPASADNGAGYDINLGYFRHTQNFKWLLRVGYNQSIVKGEIRNPRDTFYTIRSYRLDRKSINLAVGVYKPLYLIKKQLSLSVGISAKFRYNYLFEGTTINEAFDMSDKFLVGTVRTDDYLTDWRAGFSLNNMLLYEFSGGFGIGIENELYFFYENADGIYEGKSVLLNENREEIDSFEFEQVEKQDRLSRVNSISLVLSYRF